MTNIVEFKSTVKSESTLERINKTHTVYVCYDCELQALFGTPSLSQAKRYCFLNDCNFSEYPIGTYTEQN